MLREDRGGRRDDGADDKQEQDREDAAEPLAPMPRLTPGLRPPIRAGAPAHLAEARVVAVPRSVPAPVRSECPRRPAGPPVVRVAKAWLTRAARAWLTRAARAVHMRPDRSSANR